MLTVNKYELKEGDNSLRMSSSGHMIGTADENGKMYVLVEEDTEELEKTPRPMVVSKCGQNLDEKMSVNFTGSVHTSTGEIAVVYEVL